MKLTALFLFLAAAASAAQTTMTVIAERAADAGQSNLAAGQTLTYVAHDGGYIGAGDPVAGERPPSPDLVRHQLAAALAGAGYAPALPPATPGVLITYHWGVIRHDRTHIRRPYHIDPNLRARIALVASARTVKRAENYFVGPPPPYVQPDLSDAFDLSRDPRYFVIVSAYRRDAPGNSDPMQLWRVRLSAQVNAGAMDTVISSLITAGTPFFGQDRSDPEHVKIPVVEPAAAASPDKTPRLTENSEPWVQELTRREHDEFAGETDPSDPR